MALVWDGTPTFADGQVISASAHLDSLARCVGLLHDRLVGFTMPFSGWSPAMKWGSTYQAHPEWAFRHKFNTIKYVVEHGGTACNLNLPGKGVLVTFSTDGTFSGTIDITGYGIAYNSFYAIQASMPDGGWLRVWLIAEIPSTAYPTLASFANGTTPTAQNWQDLSNYAEVLHASTSVATSPSTGIYTGGQYAWLGTIRHAGGKLAYKLKTQTNYYAGNGHIPEYKHDAYIYVNGTQVAYCENHVRVGYEKEFSGVVDLSSLGLQVGQDYKVWISFDLQDSQGSVFGGNAVVVYVYEVSDGNSVVPGVTPIMPDWQYGDYVNGSTDKKVQTVKNNLVAIKNATAGYNYPVPQNRQRDCYVFGGDMYKGISEPHGQYQTIRRHRWLHYLGAPRADGKEPTQIELKWSTGQWDDEQWQPDTGGYASKELWHTVTAASDPDEWRKIDLSGQEGLWPGVPYQIKNVLYAIEDNDA